MENQVVTTSTSKQFSLNGNDFFKGLLAAAGTPVFTILVQSINAGSWTFDLKTIGGAALVGILGYLTKNFFTPSVTQIKPVPEVSKITIEVPAPGETIKTDLPASK